MSYILRLTILLPSVSRLSGSCENLDVSQPYGPSRSLTGMALPFLPFTFIILCNYLSICGFLQGTVSLSEYGAPNDRLINEMWTARDMGGCGRDKSWNTILSLLFGTREFPSDGEAGLPSDSQNRNLPTHTSANFEWSSPSHIKQHIHVLPSVS
jgi:hypothetical protein